MTAGGGGAARLGHKVTLPVTEDCAADGAWRLHGDGRPLSSRLELTIVGPPPAPTNLTATVNDDGSVTLSWEAPDDDSITGYRILRREAHGGRGHVAGLYVERHGQRGHSPSFTDCAFVNGGRVGHVYRMKDHQCGRPEPLVCAKKRLD